MTERDIEDIDFDAVSFDYEQPDSGQNLSVADVFGGPSPNKQSGANNTSAQGEAVRYNFYPTWRSQLINIIAFFALCILSVYGSRYFGALVIKGKLFSIGDTTYYLYLPLLVLVPGFLLGKILINIYDAKYIIDERGVEAQIGLVSMRLRQPRLRYEDIRGVEPTQTLWERIMGIGSVLIGSAMTQDVEIVMTGVANPRAIQLLVNSERDRHLEELKSGGTFLKHAATSD